MRLLKKEFIYGGHLLSIGATGIVWTVAMLLDQSLDMALILLPYLCSQIVYNYDHLDDIGKSSGNSSRVAYLNKTAKFQYFMMAVYILSFAILILLTSVFNSVLAGIIISGGLLYTTKLKKQMKKITGTKNIYIASFWSALAFFVFQNTPAFWLVTLFVFVRWIINSSVFDIKDLKEDKKAGIATLPVKLGLDKTILYLHVLNIVSSVIIFFAVFSEFLPEFALTLMFFSFYSYYYLQKAKNISGSKLLKLSYVLVDGEYLLWPIVLIIGKMIIE